MASQTLLAKIHSLSDIQLAVLLSFVTKEHLIVSTLPSALDELIDGLQRIASESFGLTSSVIHCTPETNLDDFAASLLKTRKDKHPATQPPSRSGSPLISRSSHPHRSDDSSYFSSRRPSGGPGLFSTTLGSQQPRPRTGRLSLVNTTNPHTMSPHLASATTPTTPGFGIPSSPIANIILAKDLHLAPQAVQIQALELLRTGRIFTHTAVHAVPKQFLFIAVLGAESGGDERSRLTEHLNDRFMMAHWWEPEEDEIMYESLPEQYDAELDGRRRSSAGGKRSATFTEEDIATFADLSKHVLVDVEVLRYQMNLISFMRMHRAVTPGCITPTATKHFQKLSSCLAPLHGLDFVTPALVALAVRKVYLHRIQIVAPEKERSMQWGSDLAAVRELLDGMESEDVIQEVLSMVAPPV